MIAASATFLGVFATLLIAVVGGRIALAPRFNDRKRRLNIRLLNQVFEESRDLARRMSEYHLASDPTDPSTFAIPAETAERVSGFLDETGRISTWERQVTNELDILAIVLLIGTFFHAGGLVAAQYLQSTEAWRTAWTVGVVFSLATVAFTVSRITVAWRALTEYDNDTRSPVVRG